MLNILIGLITVLIYSLICYIYCYIEVNKKLNTKLDLKIKSGRNLYMDTFKYLWVIILVVLVGLDFLGRTMQYIIGKLV